MYLSIRPSELKRAVEASDLPVLVYFYTSWCTSCKKMAPEFEALASELEGLYKFIKISTEDNEEDESIVQHNVSLVPMIIFFKDNVEVSRVIGYRNREEIKDVMARVFHL